MISCLTTRQGIRQHNEACNMIQNGSYESAITQLQRSLLDLHQLNRNQHRNPVLLHQELSPNSSERNARESRQLNSHATFFPDDDYDEGMGTFSQPFYICEECDNDVCAIEATFYFNLGIANVRIGEELEALVCFEKSLNIQRNVTTFDPPRAVNGPNLYAILHNVGHCYWRAGSYTEAITHYTQALEILSHDRVAHLYPLYISSTLNCIAVCKLYAGEENSDDILVIFERALALRLSRSTNDEDDRESATIINNSGRVRFLRGEFDLALMIYREALKQRVAILGEDHIDVACSLANIAQAHEKVGNIPEAIDSYKKFSDIVLVKRSPGSQDLVASLIHIGQLCYRTSNLEEAEFFFSHALDSVKITYGPYNEKVSSILNRIGNVLFDQRKYDGAIEMYTSGLEIERSIYHDFHEQISVTVFNIAQAYKHQGKLNQSLKFCKEALDIQRELNDQEVATKILIEIGSIYARQGDHDNAISAYEEAIALCRKNQGDDLLLPSTLVTLGLIQYQKGSFTFALSSLQEAIKIFRTFKEVPILDLTRVCHNVATVWRKIGESEKALFYYKEALRLIEMDNLGSGSDYEKIASLHYEVGIILVELEDSNEALSHLKLSSQMCLDNSTIVDVVFAYKVFIALARLYSQLGDTVKAMESYRTAMDVRGASEIIDDVHESNIAGYFLYSILYKTNPPCAPAA